MAGRRSKDCGRAISAAARTAGGTEMGFVFAAFLLGIPLAIAVWELTQTRKDQAP